MIHIRERTHKNGRESLIITFDGLLDGHTIYINTNFSNIINNTIQVYYLGVQVGKSLKDVRRICKAYGCINEYHSIYNCYHNLKQINIERKIKGYAH